jgi:uncharacterized membrane protein
MFEVKKSILIDAPIEKVFGFMEDPINWPEIWPSMIEVSNVKKNDKGLNSFDWVYKMGGMKFDGHSDIIEFTQNKSHSSESKGGIQSQFNWHYEETEGKTQVKVHSKYSIPLPLVGKMAEKILSKLNEHEAEVTLANLKTRMEE